MYKLGTKIMVNNCKGFFIRPLGQGYQVAFEKEGVVLVSTFEKSQITPQINNKEKDAEAAINGCLSILETYEEKYL